MTKQKMLGAYMPEDYLHEIADRLQAEFPGTPLTYLVRALVGRWFDGKIKVTSADLKRYRIDNRKYTVKPRANQPQGIEGEGWRAAEANVPLLANPYKIRSNALGRQELDYESPDAVLWAKGWHKYYSQRGDA